MAGAADEPAFVGSSFSGRKRDGSGEVFVYEEVFETLGFEWVFRKDVAEPPLDRLEDVQRNTLNTEEDMSKSVVFVGKPFSEYLGVTVTLVLDLKDQSEMTMSIIAGSSDTFGASRIMVVGSNDAKRRCSTDCNVRHGDIGACCVL